MAKNTLPRLPFPVIPSQIPAVNQPLAAVARPPREDRRNNAPRKRGR